MLILKLSKKILVYIMMIIISFAVMTSFSSYIRNQYHKSVDTKTDLNRFLYGKLASPVFGVWKKKFSKESNLFKNHKGNAKFTMYGDKEKFASSLFSEGIDKLVVDLHEKYRISTNNASFVFDGPKYDAEKQTIYFAQQSTFVRILKANQFFVSKQCTLSANLHFSYSFKLKRDYLKLRIKSKDCKELNLTISANVMGDTIKQQEVLFHFIFCAIIIFLKLYCIIQLDKELSRNSQFSGQISLITLLILSTFELIFGFEQLILTIFDFPYSPFIVFIGISFFNLFFFILLKLVSTVLRNQISIALNRDDAFSLKKYLIKIYFKAHLTILLTFYLSLRFTDSPYLYIAWALALMPQIYTNSQSPTRFVKSTKNLTYLYVLTIIMAIYIHFFKYNFFYIQKKNGSNYQHVLVILLLTSLQVFFINIQEVHSPFFFIPKFIHNNSSHNYFQSLDELPHKEKGEEGEKVCVICLLNLDCEVENNEWEEVVENDMVLSFIRENDNNEIMVTPCKHYYHFSCLLVWMSVKMECPCCKSKLPPIC